MERQALPLIPVPFRLVVRQVRTEEGYVTDPVATRQLEVLRGLLENADGLVIATDAGRGGELVSRDLLDYLGYRKPALRLWISSLTEKAILDGFKNLREDSDFDNLAQAARARREADWILGVNASIALGIVAGMSNHSLGRVQTPTLALVCRRYLENRDFVPVSCYHLQTDVCKDGQNIYSLIAGRMLEAFSEGCVREVIRVRADYGGMEFEAETSWVKYPGWRDIYNGPDMAEEGKSLPQFHRGETLAVLETEILEDSTKPLPPFTEAGLLAAMENAGGTADGENKKKTTERCGLGTPGTRAGIIDLLVARRYVERIGNRLIPTEKGLEIYGIVGDKLIADAAMTAAWEEALREIEEGRLSAGKFMKGIHEYARKIVSELLALQVRNPSVTKCTCPKCGTGTVTFYDRVAKCGDPDCAFHLPRMFNGRTMTDEDMTRLMAGEATPFLKFTTKAGKPYEASLRMDENYKVELTFKDRRPEG